MLSLRDELWNQRIFAWVGAIHCCFNKKQGKWFGGKNERCTSSF